MCLSLCVVFIDGRTDSTLCGFLYTEGFQDWGETPEKPNDYFWGRTAADAAREVLRWFARG